MGDRSQSTPARTHSTHRSESSPVWHRFSGELEQRPQERFDRDAMPNFRTNCLLLADDDDGFLVLGIRKDGDSRDENSGGGS